MKQSGDRLKILEAFWAMKVFIPLNVDAKNVIRKRSLRMLQHTIQKFDFIAFQTIPEGTKQRRKLISNKTECGKI